VSSLFHPHVYKQQYITLEVPITGLPSTLELDGVTYQVKPDFHCSLVAVKKIIPVLVERDGIAELAAEAQITQAAFNIINDIQRVIANIGPEFRIVDQPERDRHTIVVMATVTGLGEVFNRLNQSLNLNVPTQTAHITLYARNGLPIGITNSDELARWTKPLTDAQMDQVRAQIDVGRLLTFNDAHSVPKQELPKMNLGLPDKLTAYLTKDPVIAQIYDYTQQRFDAAPQLFAHNFEHARRDAMNAIMIGEPEGADMHIVLCAAIMHDIGYLYGAHRSVHGEVGAEKLAEYLNQGNISLEPAEFKHIAECIRTHKGVIHGVNPTTLEAKVVADADHLDKFGPVGVYQVILSMSEFGLGASEAISRFITRSDKPFFTATATAYATPLKSYAKNFGADLAVAYAMYNSDESPEPIAPKEPSK